LGAGAGISERLFIRRMRRVRLLLQAIRRRNIVGDALVAIGKDASDARQRDPRHQRVEQHERHRQPDELRREILALERRKSALSPVSFGAGSVCGHDETARRLRS
jgi:hypothetical protein